MRKNSTGTDRTSCVPSPEEQLQPRMESSTEAVNTDEGQ